MSLDALVLCSLDDSINSDTDTDSGSDGGFLSSPSKKRAGSSGSAAAAAVPVMMTQKTRYGRNVRCAQYVFDSEESDGGDHKRRQKRPRSPGRKRSAVTASQPATPVRPQHRKRSVHRTARPSSDLKFAAAAATAVEEAKPAEDAQQATLFEVCGRMVDLADLYVQHRRTPSLRELVQAWVEGGVKVYDSAGHRMQPPCIHPRPAAARHKLCTAATEIKQQSPPGETLFARWKRIGHK